MDSVGELMQQAREKLGVTIEQAARDTLISRRYIGALETEAFSVLPGETYVAGFIRNYSSYLNLNPDDMVNLYRNLLIQEQPIPIKELLETHGQWGSRLRFAGGGALVVAVVLFLVYWFGLRNADVDTSVDETPPTAAAAPIPLSEAVTVGTFAVGSIIEVPIGGETVNLVLAAFDGDLVATYPAGQVRMRVGAERLLDLDGDDSPDLSVLVRDADTGQTPPQVRLLMELLSRAEPTVAAPESGAAEPPSAATVADDAVLSQAPVRVFEVPFAVVRTGPAAIPYAIDLSFRGNCLLRYTVDGGAALERFFQSSERISIDVASTATLWLSNAGVVTARFAGAEVALGNNGAVAAKVVEWLPGENDTRLVVRTIF